MSLHYNSGRLLLKNVTNDNWYYISVQIDAGDGLPHIYVDQTSAGLNFSYTSYVILRAENGDIYKLGLVTNDTGSVTYTLDRQSEYFQNPSRVFIRDISTLVMYELIAALNSDDGLIYPRLDQVTATSGNNTTLTTPYRCASLAGQRTRRCVVAAAYVSRHTVLVTVSDSISTITGEMLGEGGEVITGEDGTPISREDGESTEDGGVTGEGGEEILGEGSEEILGE